MRHIEHYDWGVSPFKDVIDSRDVIARIEELDALAHIAELDESETGELAALHALVAAAETYVEDWEYGASFIRDSYFQTYAQELAEDIGAIDDSARWPNYCIDWERAARELQMDYTSVTFDGVAYWAR